MPPASHLDQIAQDIGRLRRTTEPNTSAWWALDRIASNLEWIDLNTRPSAGQLYHQYLAISGNPQVSIEEALRTVDRRAAKLRELLASDLAAKSERTVQAALPAREPVATQAA